MLDANFWIPSDFVPIRDPHVPRIECSTPQTTPRPWRGSVRARNREKTDVSTQNCDNFQVVFLPHFRANFPPPECLPCAKEELPAIASAKLTGSLGSQAPIIGFKVETADDFMPREEDFSESVARGVHVLQEPRTVWHVLEKTSRPLPVLH